MKAGYKQTEVGVIPEEWDVFSLAEMTEPNRPISYGIVQTGPNVANGVRCLRVLDINDGRINKAELITTSKQISESYRRTVLKAGDLVMPLRGKVGDVGLVDEELEGANLTRGVALIAIRSSWSPIFCQQVISSTSTRRRLEQAMNGSALQEIPIASLRSFKISTPKPLPEQHAIATALSDVDGLLGGLDRLIAKKRDLKQAAMQRLLTGQTRLPGFHGEWGVVTAREIGVFRGGNGFPLEAQGVSSGDYPFFKVSDMNNEGNETFMTSANHWVSERTRKHLGATAFPDDAIVFAKVGAAIFLERKKILGQPSCIDNNMAALVLDKSRADVRFVHTLLLSKKLGSLVATTALPALNGKQLGDMVLALPPLPEQAAIAAALSDMDAELAAQEQRRDKTRALKQAMMQELLTGRTRLLSPEEGAKTEVNR